jgi:spore photoproduct lyase
MFKTLRPEKVYVTEDVFADARAVACVERLLSRVEGAVAERISYAELNEIAPQRWGNVPRWGAMVNPRDPDLVLTTAKFLPDDEARRFRERYPNLGIRDLGGFMTHIWRGDGEPDWRRKCRGCVCQSAWQLHSVYGCPFRCAYCNLGGVNRLFVNMETYVQHLDEICAKAPNQRLYKWDNITDVSCFEPEWGASRLLVEYFANKPDKYLEIYTGKSDNIDDLLALDHRGKTIIQWSLSARTQSAEIEKETAPWDQRIEAARKCQEAGYTVRYRFSPILPVRNWRAENAEVIERLFARTKPDVITLCAFGWMSIEEAKSCLDFGLLDPQFVAAMESAAPFLAARGFSGGGGQPIPHDARAYMFKFLIDKIRQHSPTLPISLCLETVEMWALFAAELGMPMNPEKDATYYCNCGPMCTPDNRYAKGVTPGPSWFAPQPEV